MIDLLKPHLYGDGSREAMRLIGAESDRLTRKLVAVPQPDGGLRLDLRFGHVSSFPSY